MVDIGGGGKNLFVPPFVFYTFAAKLAYIFTI